MKKKKVLAILTVATVLNSTLVFGHSGRTDSNGGHYDRSTGIYHYHNGGTSSSSSSSSKSSTSSSTSTSSSKTHTQETHTHTHTHTSARRLTPSLSAWQGRQTLRPSHNNISQRASECNSLKECRRSSVPRAAQPAPALSSAAAKTRVILENNIAPGKKLLLATLGAAAGGPATVWRRRGGRG